MFWLAMLKCHILNSSPRNFLDLYQLSGDQW